MKNQAPTDDASAIPTKPVKPTCLKCGYLLRGLPEDADCPECGTPVTKSIAKHDEINTSEKLIQEGLTYLKSGWIVLVLSGFICMSHQIVLCILAVGVGFRLYGLGRIRKSHQTTDTETTIGQDMMARTWSLAWMNLALLVVCLATNRVVPQFITTATITMFHTWLWAVIWLMTCMEARSWMDWLSHEAENRDFPSLGWPIGFGRRVALVPMIGIPALILFSWNPTALLIVMIVGMVAFIAVAFIGWATTGMFQDLHHQTMPEIWGIGNGDEDLAIKLENVRNIPTVEDLGEISLAEPTDDETSNSD